jgi:hypothetical protein
MKAAILRQSLLAVLVVAVNVSCWVGMFRWAKHVNDGLFAGELGPQAPAWWPLPSQVFQALNLYLAGICVSTGIVVGIRSFRSGPAWALVWCALSTSSGFALAFYSILGTF